MMAGIEAIVYDHVLNVVKKSHIWDRANALAARHAEYGSAVKSLAENRTKLILEIEDVIDRCEKNNPKLAQDDTGFWKKLYAAKHITTTEKGIRLDDEEFETNLANVYVAIYTVKNIHRVAFPHDTHDVSESELPTFIGSRLTDDMLEMAATKLQSLLDEIDDWLERESIAKRTTAALSQFEKKNAAFLRSHNQLLTHLYTVRHFSYDKDSIYMDELQYPTTNGSIYSALWTLKTLELSTDTTKDLAQRVDKAITILKEWGKTVRPPKTS